MGFVRLCLTARSGRFASFACGDAPIGARSSNLVDRFLLRAPASSTPGWLLLMGGEPHGLRSALPHCALRPLRVLRLRGCSDWCSELQPGRPLPASSFGVFDAWLVAVDGRRASWASFGFASLRAPAASRPSLAGMLRLVLGAPTWSTASCFVLRRLRRLVG